MNTLTAQTILRKAADESQVAAVSFDGRLRSGETISSVTSITESSGDLTLGSGTVLASSTSIEGKDVAIGRGLTFTVTGGTAGSNYTVAIKVATSASRTLIGYVTIQCRNS